MFIVGVIWKDRNLYYIVVVIEINKWLDRF